MGSRAALGTFIMRTICGIMQEVELAVGGVVFGGGGSMLFCHCRGVLPLRLQARFDNTFALFVLERHVCIGNSAHQLA